MASYLHRTAQPSTLAAFRPWGSSTGAGRIRLAAAKVRANEQFTMFNFQILVLDWRFQISDFFKSLDTSIFIVCTNPKKI